MISEDAPFRFGMAGEIQRVLNEASEDDYAFMLQGKDEDRLGWMPFQVADFVGIMTEVMRETDGVSFLEVGSGIGTKCMIARYLFGLTVAGIEYSAPLATVAQQKHRGPVWVGDALTYPYGYNNADIIWMYRPFRTPALQWALEDRIYSEMKPGAIFAGAHLEHAPEGWGIIMEDQDMGNRGAWKK